MRPVSRPSLTLILPVLLLLVLGACATPEQPTTEANATAEPGVEVHPLREAYFGDLHTHTALSIDAFITNTRTMPDDAYRYAKGEAIDHVSGQKIQIRAPLDFMAVTDHAEVIGVAMAMADSNNPLSQSELAADITSEDYATSHRAFARMVAAAATGTADTLIDPEQAAGAVRSAWQRVIEAAEQHYQPGKFTTFVAYEWTSMPNLANLHRNVIYRDANVPDAPFSSTVSNKPEDLWTNLEGWRENGADVIAIPHNSNASKGLMFPLEDSYGNPIDAAYAERRMANEPLVEITQFKGTSETHTALAPLDEFADFELWNTTVGAPQPVEPVPGSYVRNAYGRGLELEQETGQNPYKFGLIGSSDTHDSSSAVEEFNFTGGHGNADATPEIRLHSKESTLTTSSLNFSASGLAGVWAESNTREAIFDALRRKETFATSGPRIRVRFFAGEGYPSDLFARDDGLRLAYDGGVPMGGDLLASGSSSPTFAVWAIRDPNSAPLQRIQIIKGWLDEDGSHDRIYDVACSDGGTPDPSTDRCPANGATVDLADCSFSQDRGAGELQAVWTDPAFDPAQRAFYYARVIENPTCRWSTWDAVRLGVEPPASKPATLQERAWSSPIWVGSAVDD